MGLFGRLGRFWQRDTLQAIIRDQVEDVAAKLEPLWKKGRPKAARAKFVELSEKLYLANLIVWACVNELQTSAAEPSFYALDSKGETLPDDAFLPRLLTKPNRETSRFRFVATAVLHKVIGGEAFIHKVRSRAGILVELWNMRPDRVKIRTDATGFVSRYEYREDASAEPTIIEPQDMIHWMTPNPIDDYRGVSALEVMSEVGELDNMVMSFLKEYFENRAIPYAYIKTTQVLLPEERRERLNTFLSLLRDRWGRWRGLGYLDAGSDFKVVGEGPKSLALDHVLSETGTRICMALQIPPMVIGLKFGMQQSNKANMDASRKMLWLETLSPLYADLQDALTLGLGEEYGDNQTVVVDTSTVRALQESQDSKDSRAIKLYSAGIAFRDEAREMADLEPVDGDKQVILVRGEPMTLGESVPTEESRLLQWPRRLDSLWEIEKHASGSIAQVAERAATFAVTDPELTRLAAIFGKITKRAGTDALADLNLSIAFDAPGAAPAVEARSTLFAKRILNDHAKDIGKTAGAAKQAELRSEVMAIFDQRLGKGGLAGATEANGSANLGRLRAFLQAKKAHHVWTTVGDDRVREEHIFMDGEEVKVGQNFSNGMPYPDEPGCRCQTIVREEFATGPQEEFVRSEGWIAFFDEEADAIEIEFKRLVEEQRSRVLEALKEAGMLDEQQPSRDAIAERAAQAVEACLEDEPEALKELARLHAQEIRRIVSRSDHHAVGGALAEYFAAVLDTADNTEWTERWRALVQKQHGRAATIIAAARSAA